MSDPAEPGGGQRIDRWLWYTRLLKSRTLAASLASSGKMRVNGERISKASRHLRPGDVLTFPLGPHIRVIKVVASGTRRGPAPDARTLYEDLAPPAPRIASDPVSSAPARDPGSGRPTKKERRRTDALKENE